MGDQMLVSPPSFPQYVIGLIIVAAVSAILYFAQHLIGISQLEPVICLIIGLFAGQLLGSFVSRGSSQTSSEPEPIKTIYVGNIAYSANRHELEELFSQYGEVDSVRIMTDKQTRKSRGYGFVEMNESSIKKAIDALNGYQFKGRNLKVNEAAERSNR